MRRFVLTVAVVLALAVAGPAFVGAESLPSSKATFAYNDLVALQTDCYSAGCNDDGSWQVILNQMIKMANQKDLFIDASLQCGIVTDATVKSLNGSDDSAEVQGTVRVRVKLTDPDGNVSYAQPDSGYDAAGTQVPEGVVFCDRIQTLRAKFSGLNCIAAPYEFTDTNGDGIDDVVDGSVTCSTPEELQLILKTLNATSFNFAAPNRVPGVHKIEVQARTSANVSTTGPDGSLGKANAFIGAGSVAVEAVRMIKGNTGETPEF